MRILVIEDDIALANTLTKILREESYAVDIASDGQEAEWLTFENPYDLILLDLMLPRKDGLSVLKTLRSGGILCPILILTAKEATNSVIEALDAGADDYLKKPFNLEELTARIRALLRRKENLAPSEIKVGPITINSARKEILINDTAINFTVKEYALLEYFIRNQETVLTRTQLSEHVWDINFEPSSNVVDVYVGYLRNKINKVLDYDVIKTIRGHGYMFDINKTKEFNHMDRNAFIQNNSDEINAI